ncbi:MAG: hypothetical protein CVU09_09105 [Bacteroidetes bacterium HGW-Bacteroidetes-4]|nr:MAG: hypothetical protein CVU09_09105 [Bacteroidetes bacterium HGW-Bacteroidetes-4]
MKKLLAFIIGLAFTFIGSSQSLLINEFSSQNASFFDEDRDASDWFELYNPTTSAINLSGWSVSDDSTDLLQWQFPDYELKAKEFMLVFASGKDRKEQVFYDNVIAHGDNFYYTAGSVSIPNDWKNLGFDASSWENGPSGFGYGDNDDATLVPEGTLSVFIRKEFQLSHTEQIVEALLHMDYDDGFVAWLNGVEIARANLGTPNTAVPYNQVADTYIEPFMINGKEPEKYLLANFESLLLEGTNVLAVQVHNNSNTSSDLTLIPFLTFGYSLPVEPTNPMPEVLALTKKQFHTNFKLGAEGERLYLVSPDGEIVDIADSVALPSDVSYGRFADGEESWYYFGEPTPGTSNQTRAYAELTKSQVNFSIPGGVYSSMQTLSLSSTGATAIYYTTDGSEPDTTDTKYTGPISVSTSKVIRAIAVNSEQLSIYPSLQTYIIESRDIKLSILSLTTDPYNLWDYNYGIYVFGPNAESSNPFKQANFWMDWERPVFIELADANGTKVFESPGGTKIFGAYSRAAGLNSLNDDPKKSQKSMALFARKAYGNSSFDYPFFKEREHQQYQSFIIRNSGNDWNYTAFRDAMMTGLLNELDIDRQAYQPVVVYLNGNYWGLLNMREKINEAYLENNHPQVDADKVDILEGNAWVVEGSADHYNQMMNFIRSNDISKANVYDSIKKLMDITNFMDYQIAQIYFDNGDWPGNNIKFWRPQTPTGKWRWLIYDTDFGFGLYNVDNYKYNTLNFALATNGPDWPNPPWSTYLLRRLLENPEFKSEFINRFADRMNYDFKKVRVTHLIDSLKANIASEIPYHNNKWNHMWDFEGNVVRMKTFGNNRSDAVYGHIDSRFGLGGKAYLSVNVSDKSHGYVQVSSLKLKNFPWIGAYFRNNPVRVTAIPNPGFEFSHWEGISSTLASELLNFTSANTSIKAVFKVSVKEYNSLVINEINYRSATEQACGDWVEFFNTTSGPIDVSGWVFKDADNSHAYIIPSGTIIPPKGFLVLYERETKFKFVYPSVSNAVGPFDFGLSSAEEALRLYDSAGRLIDSVLYMGEEPWPSIENGGETLSLIDPYKNNEPYYRWELSAGYGTPGAQNDNYNSIRPSVSLNQVLASAFPNPFNQQFTVRWKNQSGHKVTIQLFDFKGSQIGLVEEKTYPAGTFEVVYATETVLPTGLYFVKITYDDSTSQLIKLIKQ